MTQPEVITFGCRLNIVESEIIRKHCKVAKLKKAIIINTCAVTSEAERQARQTIRKIRRAKPDANIIVTGCAAQLNPSIFERMSEVNFVLGNEEKLHLINYSELSNQPNKVIVSNIMEVSETASHLVEGFGGRSRAFVQIQQGCDHRCTFCIIPFARGKNRSLPFSKILDQVEKFVDSGFKEIVLTGVDICSYGVDLVGKQNLGELVKSLLKAVPNLPRLRLSSIDPGAIDDQLVDVFSGEERLMPHLHLSLQAMDNMILKRMKRRHLVDDVINLCERVRKIRPDIVFGADLIAGFPTESSEMFQNSIKKIIDLKIAYLHIFPFSERRGTPAAKMPAVNRSIRKERAAILRKIGELEKAKFFQSLIGSKAEILLEKNNRGLSQHFASVEVLMENSDSYKSGQLVNVTLGEGPKGSLIGHLS